MPNTSTTKVLIAKKYQFIALQYKIPEIELDITYTNKAIVSFKSRIPLSLIGIIQVFTLIDTTNFHIINPSISFFLYLKNMDILGIYLNNITN